VRQEVCRSEAESNAQSDAARDFLKALTMSAGNWNEAIGFVAPPPGPQVVADIGTGVAQGEGQTGTADALKAFEEEWNRLLSEDRQLFRAVVRYTELQNEYDRARGSATAAPEPALAVVLEDTPVTVTAGPQCEASTLTEYEQRNNIARVTGKVSVGACPAGTTGSFTLVARVRDDNDETRLIELNETWQRGDTEDHSFDRDFPIGDNVYLMSVRVRDLKCTCADSGQAAVP
jgi:hypothetical protein